MEWKSRKRLKICTSKKFPVKKVTTKRGVLSLVWDKSFYLLNRKKLFYKDVKEIIFDLQKDNEYEH